MAAPDLVHGIITWLALTKVANADSTPLPVHLIGYSRGAAELIRYFSAHGSHLKDMDITVFLRYN